MEAFRLLKYWRGGGGAPTTKNTTIIAASALPSGAQSEDDNSDVGEDDEGPFLDLDFAVPDEYDGGGGRKNGSLEVELDGTDEEDVVATLPSDDVTSLSSLVFESSDHTGKQHQHLPGSLLKSATKLRVFTSKKLKSPAEPKHHHIQQQQNHSSNKLFAVKFKVEEVPIVSLFTRDNSSRSFTGKSGIRPNSDDTNNSDERRTSKELMNKYLNKIKPLYVKVSRRSHDEKSKFFGPDTSLPGVNKDDGRSGGKNHASNHVHTGLRVVRKHLGKSRSASSAVAAVPTSPARAALPRRRDDSLLQQEDGIQSAIAHCKRSFSGTREADSTLPRSSRSDSCDERSDSEKCKED